MSDMNTNDVRSINQRSFEQTARFECEASVGTGRYVPCGKPATKVIEWRHQDGDYDRSALCDEHAVAEQRYWSAMDWDTGVEVSVLKIGNLWVRHGGRTATRVGSRYRDAAA